MPRTIFRSFLYAVTVLSALSALGCGQNDPKLAEHKAEKVVDEFLDAWSRGESPEKFAAADRTIQGSDPDWKAGHRLLSFLSDEVKGTPEKPDRIRCRVALSLQDRNGNKWDKKVEYEVQVGDKILITRVSP